MHVVSEIPSNITGAKSRSGETGSLVSLTSFQDSIGHQNCSVLSNSFLRKLV